MTDEPLDLDAIEAKAKADTTARHRTNTLALIAEVRRLQAVVEANRPRIVIWPQPPDTRSTAEITADAVTAFNVMRMSMDQDRWDR